MARRSPERAKAVLDRAARMKAFRAPLSERRVGDPQMRTTGPKSKSLNLAGIPPEAFTKKGRQTVALKDVVTDQPTISVKAAKGKVDQVAAGKTVSVRLIQRPDGKFTLLDGNHGTTALRALGHKHVTADVVTVKPNAGMASATGKPLSGITKAGIAMSVAAPAIVGTNAYNARLAAGGTKTEAMGDAIQQGTVAGAASLGATAILGGMAKAVKAVAPKAVSALGPIGLAIGAGATAYGAYQGYKKTGTLGGALQGAIGLEPAGAFFGKKNTEPTPAPATQTDPLGQVIVGGTHVKPPSAKPSKSNEPLTNASVMSGGAAATAAGYGLNRIGSALMDNAPRTLAGAARAIPGAMLKQAGLVGMAVGGAAVLGGGLKMAIDAMAPKAKADDASSMLKASGGAQRPFDRDSSLNPDDAKAFKTAGRMLQAAGYKPGKEQSSNIEDRRGEAPNARSRDPLIEKTDAMRLGVAWDASQKFPDLATSNDQFRKASEWIMQQTNDRGRAFMPKTTIPKGLENLMPKADMVGADPTTMAISNPQNGESIGLGREGGGKSLDASAGGAHRATNSKRFESANSSFENSRTAKQQQTEQAPADGDQPRGWGWKARAASAKARGIEEWKHPTE